MVSVWRRDSYIPFSKQPRNVCSITSVSLLLEVSQENRNSGERERNLRFRELVENHCDTCDSDGAAHLLMLSQFMHNRVGPGQ